MKTLIVTGASDDLIETEGDLSEEFYAVSGKGRVEFSHGVVLDVAYVNPGIWRITVVKGAEHVSLVPCADEEDGEVYTDTATVTGNFDWVACGDDKHPL